MKKYNFLMALCLSVFFLVGFSTATVQAAEYKDSLVSFQYPSNWSKPSGDFGGTSFVAISPDSTSGFNANMNLVESSSDPSFANMSAETFKEQYSAGLSGQGITNVKFATVEKITWQNSPGLYVLYQADYSGGTLNYLQVFRDNGKNLIILTFVCSANEWEKFGPQFEEVIKSTVFY